MIEIRGLAKSYGAHQALKDVTLTIRPNLAIDLLVSLAGSLVIAFLIVALALAFRAK